MSRIIPLAVVLLCVACSGKEPKPTSATGASVKANPVQEMRVALTVDAYDKALHFYRDGLKMRAVETWDRPDGSGAILDAGRATLEILSTKQVERIDRIEVGRRISGPVRLGLDVEEPEAVARAFEAGGAERLAGPAAAPWGTTFRMRAPDGMQYTLYAGPGEKTGASIRELRIALTVDKYDEALRFYRDGLGLPVRKAWAEPEGSGAIFEAGRATLELLSTKMAESVDRIEVGPRVAGPVRVALEVDDSAKRGEALMEAGAQLLGGPVVTPWLDKNVRLRAPDGMQYTLFTKSAR
ncbi:VOC family protein [Pendulispora brunnea]|uniref:VOC family protein n=1 Tax=Pendulispora brunnea TaxID=2905690 RepID=A0ABZ2K1W8_9BACT